MNKNPPKWLRKVLDLIHTSWHYHDNCNNVMMRAAWEEENNYWHIQAAPVFQEVYGGDDDGKQVWAGFVFDIGEFGERDGVWIQKYAISSYCHHCSPSPKLMILGKFRGHQFFLTVFQEPVQEVGTTEIIDTINQEIRDKPESEEQ